MFRKNNKYSPEIFERIEVLREEGRTWPQIAGVISTEYNIKTRAESLCKCFRNYIERYEDTAIDENINIEILKQQRRSSQTALKANRKLRQALDTLNFNDSLLAEMKKELVKIELPTIEKRAKKKTGRGITVEALLSDCQVGKLSKDYNKEIAEKRFKRYGEVLLFKMKQLEKSGYKFDRVILVLLGDMIESTEKATLKNSPHGTDCYTAEQISLCTRYIWQYVMIPLIKLNVPIRVVGIPGNHDGVHNGMTNQDAGRALFTYCIYDFLKMLCENSKSKNVTFNITDGVFATEEIYGHTVVYEHGYKVPAQESAMAHRLAQRARQLQKYVTYFRMGDKHNITRFNEDTLVVNGAFFGMSSEDLGSEYSSVSGYSAFAGQIVFFHIDHGDERLPCFDSIVIQLNHIR